MSLKELRMKNGYSQEKLAELSNLSIRTIQRIEKENHGSLESLKAMAKVFKLEFEEFKNIIQMKNEKEEIKYNSFLEFIKNDKSIKRYFLVNILLIIINLLTSTAHLWFIYPLLAWGIPLFYKKYLKYKALKD